jgi:hypothetical protein
MCWITERGLAVLDALDEPVRAAEEQLLSMLSRDEQSTLIGLLDRIRGGQPA